MTNARKQSVYSQKLQHPKWQEKRACILQRDKYACQYCGLDGLEQGDDALSLHVHHLDYEHGKDPWDIDDDLLITLCEACHESESVQMAYAVRKLTREIKKRFRADAIRNMAMTFSTMNKETASKFWRWVRLSLCGAYHRLPQADQDGSTEAITEKQVDYLIGKMGEQWNHDVF